MPKFQIFLLFAILLAAQVFIYYSYQENLATQCSPTGTTTYPVTAISTPAVNAPAASAPATSALVTSRIVEQTFDESELSEFLDLEEIIQEANGTRSQTTAELDFLLNLRKLVLCSVREVNLRITGHECARWWANPLSVFELRTEKVSKHVTLYTLNFEIQPGRIPFQTVVSVTTFDGDIHEPDDLVLVSARRLEATPTNCGTVPASLRPICLCRDEVAGAEERSKVRREEWKRSDPELLTWPPNLSFLTPDYVTFGSLDAFLKSPLKNTNVCGPNVKMVIFVSCSPFNFDGRNAIRKTYGNATFLEKHGVKLFFIYDRIEKDKVELQKRIDDEFAKYEDIIQANNGHSYRNLTLRDLAIFNWIVTSCQIKKAPLPPWIIKTDDDYFINVPLALEVADANPDAQIMGGHNCGQPVVRDAHDQRKYYTPKYIHTAPKYAGYLSGATWLIKSSVLGLLLKASLNLPFIPADDVYISGMLTREVGIRPRGMRLMSYGRRAGPCKTKQAVNSVVHNASDWEIQWKYLNEPTPKDCTFDRSKLKADAVSAAAEAACYFTVSHDEYDDK